MATVAYCRSFLHQRRRFRMILYAISLLLVFSFILCHFEVVPDVWNPLLTFIPLEEGKENSDATQGKCLIPNFDPFHPGVLKFVKKLPELKCKGERYGRISGSELHLKTTELSNVLMAYMRRPQGDDFRMIYTKDQPVDLTNVDKDDILVIKPEEDFIKLTMTKSDGSTVSEFHAVVVPKRDVIKHAEPISKEINDLGLNVAFVMLDSVSAASFERSMPKTKKALTALEDTFFFKGHSIVGDGTTAQLCAIFTGFNEQDLPEARRSFSGAAPVDRWPFIFKDFKNRGYVTMYLEDCPATGAFNYRLMGFTNPPADHYTRPFFLGIKKEFPVLPNLCYGNWAVHNYSLQYTKSFYDTYKNVKKFSLSIVSRLPHSKFGRVQLMDKDLENFLSDFKDKGYFDNTIFILFGDHGSRISGARASIEGKLEERMPFLSVTVPKWFKTKHKDFYASLLNNTKVLTSHYDLYGTLRHMLTFPNTPKVKTGQSLFKKINPETRTCKRAGIADHWCPCLGYVSVSTNDLFIRSLAEKSLTFINELLASKDKSLEQCHQLKLNELVRAGKVIHNWKMEQFARTRPNSRCDSCLIVYKKGLASIPTTYELVFSVTPSNGMFEVTVKVKNGVVEVDPNISRINAYGSQPDCIASEYPHLRKYCYCRRKSAVKK